MKNIFYRAGSHKIQHNEGRKATISNECERRHRMSRNRCFSPCHVYNFFFSIEILWNIYFCEYISYLWRKYILNYTTFRQQHMYNIYVIYLYFWNKFSIYLSRVGTSVVNFYLFIQFNFLIKIWTFYLDGIPRTWAIVKNINNHKLLIVKGL